MSTGPLRWRCGSISRIGARFGRRGPKRGSVVITTPPAEQHSTPVAIAADLLRWAGFNVIELGADTPADALTETLAGVPTCWPSPWRAPPRTRPPRPVGSSPICASHCRRSRCWWEAPPSPTPTRPAGLGADGFTGRRGDDLVRAVEELAADR